MDDKKPDLAEAIYRYLLTEPCIPVCRLSEKFELREEEIISAINTLIDMGADVSIKKDTVVLNTPLPLLNSHELSDKIKSCGIQAFRYYFSLTSTNNEAGKHLENCIVITDHQNQGRGRRGKTWLTPLAQSIAVSLHYSFNLPIKNLSGLNVVIATAVMKTLDSFSINGFCLKWPNDIMGPEGKVAGILIEASGNSRQSQVTIGVGINWNIRSELLKQVNQKCMNLPTEDINKSEFIVILIKQILNALKDFSCSGLTNFLSVWNQYDNLYLKPVNILQGENTISGIYYGVDESGLLRVLTDGKIKTYASAEVSLRKVD